jgi:peptidoglycan/LPS O-acetylase OafA/YrhL
LAVISFCVVLGGWLEWSGYEWSSTGNRIYGYTVIALTFASVLLWVLHFRGAWQTAWLRIAPLRYVGRISYGIYLLQVPADLLVGKTLAQFGRQLAPGESWHTSTWGEFFGVAVGALLLASLSWYSIESPILRAKERLMRSVDLI